MLNTTKDRFELQPLREFYQAGHTRTYAFRKKQLEKLKQAVLDHEGEINKALHADLKKNQEEAWATETGLLLMEINIMLRNLKKWMSPKSVSTNLLNLPSTSKLHKDPLGVVLIISPWNYPFQLALSPLAGAIAGGNCAVIKPSEMASATSTLINHIISKTFDSNYIKVIEGDGAELVPVMMDEFRFDHIFYTGSLNVGRSIYRHAAEHLIPVTLE
ncbi:MAG: aldehyde dehydrogenase family protein, partial [Chitinophagaceae bacterium]|nr:aldehyde dehydrogenase family protein [Chitinophagaceae bacterium]